MQLPVAETSNLIDTIINGTIESDILASSTRSILGTAFYIPYPCIGCVESCLASETGFCSCETNDNGRGVYSWPEVQVNGVVSYPCQYGPLGFNVTRICSSAKMWLEDATNCITAVTNAIKSTNVMFFCSLSFITFIYSF